MERAVEAVRGDHDLALALGVLAERDHAVDLADDGVILRLAGFEQLGDAGQTAGDVLHLGGVARDLGDGLAGVIVLAFERHDVGAHRQQVASVEVRVAGSFTASPVSGSMMRDARAEIRRARLDHDLARQTGDLVDLLDDGDALDQVAVLHDAADLGEDRRREWIPLGHDLTQPSRARRPRP